MRLATAFAYWSLPQIFFLGLYALLGEVLNARKSFGPFTWAPVLNNVIGIASIGVFMAVHGADPDRAPDDWSAAMIALLAGGATLGIATQAVVLFAFWRRVGLSYRPDFGWRGVGLGSAARAAGWTLGMLVAGQVAGVVETNVSLIATGRGASAATMATSWLIFMLPHSIITVSIVTALYTTMSEHASRGDLTALRGDLTTALRAVALALTLATAVLIVCAGPFARVFTGDFGDVQQMAAVIVAYLVGLVPFSLLFVVQRVFYSLGDTRTPFAFTIVQVVLVIGGVLACSLLPVERIAMGIAAVVSIAGAIQLVIASVLLRRKVAADPAPIARSLILDLAAAVPAGIAGYLVGAPAGRVSGGWLRHVRRCAGDPDDGGPRRRDVRRVRRSAPPAAIAGPGCDDLDPRTPVRSLSHAHVCARMVERGTQDGSLTGRTHGIERTPALPGRGSADPQAPGIART